jgi:hypothetical protein
MTAIYHGVPVRVIRVEAHRAYIVWHGKIKRVTKTELQNEEG